MRYFSAVVAFVLLMPLGAFAQWVHFSLADCDAYYDLPAFSNGEQARTHSYTDRLACSVFSSTNTTDSYTLSVEAQSFSQELFDAFKQTAAQDFHYCDSGVLCDEVVTDEDGYYESRIIFSLKGGARHGFAVRSVDVYRGYVIAADTEVYTEREEAPYPALGEDVLARTKQIIDEKLDGDARDDVLRIVSFTEDVEVRSGSGEWEFLTQDRRLSSGDEISTGADSSVVIAFPDGSRLKLEEFTEISVDFLLNEGNALRAQVALRFGEVAARVNPDKTSVTDFSVHAPIATASVRGTVFSVAYDDTRGVDVAVSEGVVDVENVTSDRISVEAGNQVYVDLDGEMTPGVFEGDIVIDDSRASRAWYLLGLILVVLVLVVGKKKLWQ